MYSQQDKIENDIKSNSSPVSTLYFPGIGITFAYLIGMAFYAWFKWEELIGLSPNEFGDFLAGAFAPLAFAWLILGFFQQGYELRQNSTALRLQVEELRSAASHAGAMVDLQRKDIDMRINDSQIAQQELEAERRMALEIDEQHKKAEAIKRAQPKFHFTDISRKRFSAIEAHQENNTLKWSVTLENLGAKCINFTIRTISNDFGTCELNIHENAVLPIFETHNKETFTLYTSNWEKPFLGQLIIEFDDALGVAKQQSFTFRKIKHELEII